MKFVRRVRFWNSIRSISVKWCRSTDYWDDGTLGVDYSKKYDHLKCMCPIYKVHHL